jgi:hypothetical protein
MAACEDVRRCQLPAWRLWPDSGLVNAKSGTCPDSTAGTGQLSIQPCAAIRVRTWRNIRLYANWARIMGIVGKCGHRRERGCQRHRPDSSGPVENPVSGRCLGPRGGGSADGNRLVIMNCADQSWQRWALPFE